MKRFRLAVTAFIILALAIPVAAQSGRQAQQTPLQQQQVLQNQVQQRITDLYISDFRRDVGLSEDQFLKLAAFIRQFIQMRFNAPRQRELLNQRLNQLLEQPDPSEEAVRQLSEEKAILERRIANSETNFIEKMRPDLTPRQVLLVVAFNRKFFEETMPGLIERARATAPTTQQQQRPNANGRARPGPGNALQNPR